MFKLALILLLLLPEEVLCWMSHFVIGRYLMLALSTDDDEMHSDE